MIKADCDIDLPKSSWRYSLSLQILRVMCRLPPLAPASRESCARTANCPAEVPAASRTSRPPGLPANNRRRGSLSLPPADRARARPPPPSRDSPPTPAGRARCARRARPASRRYCRSLRARLPLAQPTVMPLLARARLTTPAKGLLRSCPFRLFASAPAPARRVNADGCGLAREAPLRRGGVR